MNGLTKPRPYGTAKEAAARLVCAAGGIKRAAGYTRVGKTRIQAYTDPDMPGAHMPVDVAAKLTLTTGHRVMAEYFAYVAGGVFLPLRPEARGSIASDGARIAKEASEFFERLYEALDDGEISAVERAGLLAEIDDVIRVLADSRARLSRMFPSPPVRGGATGPVLEAGR